MRNILNTGMWAGMVVLLLAACDPMENDELDLGRAPAESELAFSVNPMAGQPNVVEFINTSQRPGVALWNLGNGTTGKGDKITSEYPFKGDYQVALTLYTDGGSATFTQTVTIANDDLTLLQNPLYTALTGGADNLEGKTWVFEQYQPGHFGIGPADQMTPSWWEAAPNDKLESSMYNQTFTFKQVGVAFIWENQGWIYTNQAGVDDLASKGYTNSVVPPAGDFDVAYVPEDNYTFSLVTSDSTLILSNGAFLGHYAGTSRYKILSISENEMYLRAASTVETGNAWYYRLVPEELNVEPVIPLKVKPLFEDFEDLSYEVVFEKGDMGALTDSSYQNPAPVPINPSSRVFLYEKKAGTFYSNISFTAEGYKFDLTNQNQITLKVYIPSYNDYVTENNVAGSWIANKMLQASIAVKLQNGELGDNSWQTQTEILQTGLVKDQWLELNFDFSGVADREDYDKIVIQFGTEGHDGGGIFFFDDFNFHE